jgi:rod shape-determining protein MreB
LLRDETGLPVHIADDPLSAVAEGTGRVLNEIEVLRSIAQTNMRGSGSSM